MSNDNTEVLASLIKAAAPPTILGISMSDLGVALAIVAALFNIITTGPAVVRVVRGWFKKED